MLISFIQVRLDAFALLCENQKTTEIISDLELDLIKGFVPYNLNNQMPSFRQHFLSHLKKVNDKGFNVCLFLKACLIECPKFSLFLNPKELKK